MKQRRKKTQFFFDIEKVSLQRLTLLKSNSESEKMLVRLCDEIKQKTQTQQKQQKKTLNGDCRAAKQNSFLKTFWKKIRLACCNTISHKWFESFIMGIILLNTVVLTIYHHGMDPQFSDWLEVLNQVSKLHKVF